MVHFDDLQAKWDELSGVSEDRLDAIADKVVRNHDKMKSILDSRDRSELLTCAVMAIVFSLFAWYFLDYYYVAFGCLIIVAACFEVAAVLMWGRRGMKVSPDRLSVREFTLHQRKLVRRQIGLLRHVAWWYLLPFYVGLIVMVYGFGDRDIAIIFVIVLTVAYWWIWRINQQAVAKHLQPLDDAYTLTLKSLDNPNEEWLDRSHQALTERAQINASSKRFQIIVIVCAFLLLIPIFSLIRDARHEYDTLSPFSAVRWQEGRPEVQVDGKWYELLKIDGVSAAEIMRFSRFRYLGLSRKRFEEDLVEVMTRMGHPPGETSDLTVKQLSTGQIIVLEDVEWTKENRIAIKRRNDNPDREGAG